MPTDSIQSIVWLIFYVVNKLIIIVRNCPCGTLCQGKEKVRDWILENQNSFLWLFEMDNHTFPFHLLVSCILVVPDGSFKFTLDNKQIKILES